VNNRFSSEPEFMTMPIVGIIRNMSRSTFTEVLPIVYEAGLKNVEITMNTPHATDMIRHAIKYFGNKLIIGAGTVCNQEDLKNALAAGARFIVCPITDRSIISSCVQKEIPVIPGAFTPTEIFKAWTAGAALVKLFPATSLGPQYIRDVNAALNEIDLMPTGGIDQDNIASFFKAGAAAAGVGGRMFDASMIREKNWNGLVQHFIKFVEAVRTRASQPSSRN
jgi:2-dehydro-3-deoxyphosphogluconate aldolase/(4S)-4-hydroxy-2-oxoglutarate aldolase